MARFPFAVLVLLGGAAASRATPEHWKAFAELYEARGRLKAASCAVCHTEVPKHNAYGAAVDRAQGAAEIDNLDKALEGIEREDSDGDGVGNGDEIRADTLPGDKASKPAASPRTPPAATMAEPSAPAAPWYAPLVPKHAFHPVLVHFPVALFLFGGLLDLVGLCRRRSEVRRAGLWNMTAGAITTALTIPTGFLAASWSGYPLVWGSSVVAHLLAALGATILMSALVAWRARREVSGAAYVAILLLAMALTGWARHLGGDLVYAR